MEAADTAPSSPAPVPENAADETMDVPTLDVDAAPETASEQPQAGPSEKAPRRVYNRKAKVSACIVDELTTETRPYYLVHDGICPPTVCPPAA